METLWPPYERMRLTHQELGWLARAPEALRRDVWFARMLLKWIGRHDLAWVSIKRLRADSLVHFGGEPSAEAFREAARALGGRVSETHVGFDIRACDRLLWEAVKDVPCYKNRSQG